MKYSIKKKYKHLFELMSQNTFDEPKHHFDFNNDYEHKMTESEAFSIIETLESKANAVLTTRFNYFTIKLIIDDKSNSYQTQNVKMMYNQIINYTYFLLTQNEISLNGLENILKESLVNKKSIVKESSSQTNIDNIENFLANYFNIKEEGKTKVVTKLIKSESLQDFKAYLFYFLFKKLVNKKANLELIADIEIIEAVDDIVDFFTSLLKGIVHISL